MSNSILLGAVAYDPKVVTIWEGIRDYFRAEGVDFDFALFSNYERQVDALARRAHRHRVEHAARRTCACSDAPRGDRARSACATRDRDFHAKVVVRRDAGIRTLADLAGKTLAVGSRDSTQARILPLHFLAAGGRRARSRAAAARSTPTSASTATPARASSTCLRRSPTGAPRPARSAISSGSTSRPPGRVDPRLVDVL